MSHQILLAAVVVLLVAGCSGAGESNVVLTAEEAAELAERAAENPGPDRPPVRDVQEMLSVVRYGWPATEDSSDEVLLQGFRTACSLLDAYSGDHEEVVRSLGVVGGGLDYNAGLLNGGMHLYCPEYIPEE